MTLCWQCLQTPFRTHQGRISVHVTLEKESATRELSDLSGDSLHTLMESWVPFPAHARHLWLSGESVSHRLGLCSLQAGAVHRIEARALRRGGPAVRRADPSSPHSKVDIAWGWARQGTGPPTKMAADGATAQQARFGKDSFPKSLTTGGRQSAPSLLWHLSNNKTSILDATVCPVHQRVGQLQPAPVPQTSFLRAPPSIELSGSAVPAVETRASKFEILFFCWTAWADIDLGRVRGRRT